MRGGLRKLQLDYRVSSTKTSRYFVFLCVFLAGLTFFTQAVSASINSTSPSQYATLLQGKNQMIQIDHNYASASIFWFINGNLSTQYNNQKSFLFNTTRYILDHPEINFDDQNTDAKVMVKVIDTTNPFNSANYSWEFFVQPLDYNMTTDKNQYYTGQTILLDFNAQPDTKLDISVYDQNNNLIMKYPTVTVQNINEFLIDSPDNPGTYKIVVDSRFYEYTKRMTKTIVVSENTQMSLDNNFVKISVFPQTPSVNDTVTLDAVMNNYDNLDFSWDLNSDGTYDKTGKEIQATFNQEKQYIIKLYIKNRQTLEEITRYITVNVGDDSQVVKLYIKDFFTKNPITNSKIVIDNVEYPTDSSGELTVGLNKGSHSLRIANPDYNEYTQTLNIQSNYLQTIYLYKSDQFNKAVQTDTEKPKITLISPENNAVMTDLLTTFLIRSFVELLRNCLFWRILIYLIFLWLSSSMSLFMLFMLSLMTLGFSLLLRSIVKLSFMVLNSFPSLTRFLSTL